MTSREDLRRYQASVDEAVGLARTDVADVLASLLGRAPEVARDELLAYLPELMDVYGDVVAAAAADWYEDVMGGTYRAVAGATAPASEVQAGVRAAAAGLFAADPAATARALSGAVQLWVSYAGRDTIARNVRMDPRKPRWARIPSGKTCAWCTMLASRGWVYTSKASAGGDQPKHYHADCDCQIVPQHRSNDAHFDGYDPDRLYDMYTQAFDLVVAEGGQPDDKAVAAAMRRLHPDSVSDGVHS